MFLLSVETLCCHNQYQYDWDWNERLIFALISFHILSFFFFFFSSLLSIDFVSSFQKCCCSDFMARDHKWRLASLCRLPVNFGIQLTKHLCLPKYWNLSPYFLQTYCSLKWEFTMCSRLFYHFAFIRFQCCFYETAFLLIEAYSSYWL